MVRTVGLEEELLLFDPDSREVVPAAPRVLKAFREHGTGRTPPEAAADDVDPELFRHQLETRTDPVTDLGEAGPQLVAARRTAGTAARDAGLAIGACGVVPLAGDPVVTSDDRYRDMVDTYGEVARGAGTCGMHVHVGIGSDEEGVAVIDRIAPWLPLLLALSANSPYVEGRDSGYASWRAQVWSRWPSAGPTEPFGSVQAYREVCRTMLDLGAARDPGMLYLDARLAAEHPTVEIRVCDVCADPAEAVVVAALARGLVETAAREWAADAPAPRWRSETLRVAQWRAARFGTTGSLVDPGSGRLRPAREVLDALVRHVGDALAEAGDSERVERGIAALLTGGGAARQRAAYERTGDVAGVVDDVIARTAQTWAGV